VNEVNYFDLTDRQEQQEYKGVLYAQLRHCMYIGSMDTTNPGKVKVQNEAGQMHEIVRVDFRVAFINSVRMLVALARDRMKKEKCDLLKPYTKDTEQDIDIAYHNFDTVLKYCHDEGIFGRRALVCVWDWRLERERLSQNAYG
jgi:hypothetical protein